MQIQKKRTLECLLRLLIGISVDEVNNTHIWNNLLLYSSREKINVSPLKKKVAPEDSLE